MWKRSWLALALALVMYPVAGHAQLGVYGEGNETWVSGKALGGDSPSGPSGHANAIGGTFGAFYDFLHLGPLALGADGRYSFAYDGAPALYGNALTYWSAGPRISAKIPALPLRPYAQAGILRARTNYAAYSEMHGGLGYSYQVGVDVDMLPHLGARVEYSGGYSGGMGSNTGITSLTFNQVQGGLVFWFLR